MRSRRPFPRHPYPVLLAFSHEAAWFPPSHNDSSATKPLSAQGKRILQTIRQGARVLFDPKRGRALVYRFRQGFEQVAELTVRMLAALVKEGYLIASGKEGEVVHYLPTARLR